MSGTGVEKLQTILMAQVSTIDQPDQISIDYTIRFKLSLFRYKLWMDTSTSMHTCIFINNGQFVLLIPCDFRLDDLITYNYFGHLEYLTFCFACRLFTRILSLHPFFNSTAVQKSSKLQKRRKQKPRKGIYPEIKSIKLQDEKMTLKCFFWCCKPQGKFILETIEDRDAWRTFRGPPSPFRENKFFFCKTIGKGKVQAKYLKHLNYSFILIIGFFFFFWELWF